MSMRLPTVLLFLLTCLASMAVAQQQAVTPRLAQRHEALAESGVFVPGHSDLPDEASGSYALSPNPAEVVEIILNNEGDGNVRLQGYLTRIGDGVSDRGAPLTYFFERSTVGPEKLTFITRQVHSVWWSFSGTIDRGSVQSSAQKGYYFLNGMLTEHFDNGQSAPQRVSLPLLPEAQSSQ